MITLTLTDEEARLAHRILIRGIKGFNPQTRTGEESVALSLFDKAVLMAVEMVDEDKVEA